MISTVYPDGNGISYVYDDIGNLTNALPAQITADQQSYTVVMGSANVAYTYDTALRLSTIETATGTTYTFAYDGFGNTTEIDVGNRTLASYTYNAKNGKLNTLTYGNGDSVKYIYDALDRVAEIQYNIGENGNFETVYTYEYDSAGNLHSLTDNLSGQVTVYRYDVESKLISSYVYDIDTYVNLYGTAVTYDDMSRVDTVTQSYDYALSSGVAQDSLVYTYEYDGETGNIASLSMDGDNVTAFVEPDYDRFGRMTNKVIGMLISDNTVFFAQQRWSYVAGTDGQQSGRVSEYTSEVYRIQGGTIVSSTTYRYTYDANGNITLITDTSNNILQRYTYDALGQLTREDNNILGKTYTFAYDNAGNITSKKTYAYTTGTLGTVQETISYTYGDNGWKDLLTAYNGIGIEYDEIGNPIEIGDAVLSWQGRQLTSYVDGNTTITYTYNEEGIRTSKTITTGSNVTRHDYILSGTQIVRETVYLNNVEQYTLVYFYDETGSPLGMKYRTPTYADGVFDGYIFEKNLQGDIVAIYDLNTNKIVEYKYDAWGNFTVEGSQAATVGVINPFRYRGYYFDNEIGLYYVNSRYYNAEWGRFLNLDAYITTGQGLISFNMFAYCLNEPVGRIDIGGTASLSCLQGEHDLLDRELFEHGGGGSAYRNYLVRAGVASYDGQLVGYHTGSVPSTYYNMDYYVVPGAVSDFVNLGVCFVAGTLVVTETGYKPIEDVKVGDLVVSHNPETGETAIKKVVDTFINEATKLIHIVVNGKEIVCTEEHPFYSPIKGWIAACDLRVGDILATLDGECTVERVWIEILDTPVLVYNFEVEDFHTYYVEDVLVHNKCEPTDKSKAYDKAKSLGYSMSSQKNFPHGQKVFYNSKASRNMRYISYDATVHNGGVWKAASSVRDLYSKTTRTGTYNWDLTERIGD